jgi:hypothetical protein
MQRATPTYRQLPVEEWHRLQGIYEANGDVLPPSGNNLAIVAELDGRIVGLWGCNVIVHAGPLWVDTEWRGLGVSDAMGDQLEATLRSENIPGYLMFPSNAQSERVAQRRGLTEMNCKIFKKEL